MHPSFLALDRAALGAASAEVQSHITGCSTCQEHVRAVQTPPNAAGFAAIRERAERERAERERVVRRPWLWAGGTALLAAAAACMLFLVPSSMHSAALHIETPSELPYVASKGFLSVWIYVKRGPNTELWDGKRPLLAGDQLRIKVDPGGYHRVAVYSVQDPANPALLYEGAVNAGQSTTLPDAWEVDTGREAERLLVVFADEQIAPVWTRWLQGDIPPEVTMLRFVLPKAANAEPATP